MKLSGRVAIITGAGSGIGRESALVFAQEGARVCAVDINADAAAETAALVRSGGGDAISCEADVSGAADVEKMVQGVWMQYGRIDVLFNNAGIPMRPTPVHEVSEELWDHVMEVNLKSVFLACKFAVPYMKQQRSGAILNTASISGVRPRAGSIAYTTSKGAVISLTKALAIELAPYGIRANCICPVATDTKMLPLLVKEDAMDGIVASIPLGRLGKPRDVAEAAVYLASDAAEMVTGVSLNVDGGRGI